mmetsp:Transcript_37311/g.80328  ORF Transcript_37311/g.80328 Transcript_37311/m.80328 type:complete len:245 (-) Transcript_37311:376-1110(-)
MFQNLLLNKSWCTFQKIKSAVIHGIPLTKSLQCIDVGIAITGSHQSPWSHRRRVWLTPRGSLRQTGSPLVALGDLMHRLHGLMHRVMHRLMHRRVHGFPCLFAVADDQGRVVALALLRGLEVLQDMDANIRGQLLQVVVRRIVERVACTESLIVDTLNTSVATSASCWPQVSGRHDVLIGRSKIHEGSSLWLRLPNPLGKADEQGRIIRFALSLRLEGLEYDPLNMWRARVEESLGFLIHWISI